jgi:hypothetical protein
VKVISPLGEFPLAFRRLERHEDGVAVVAMVAGIESSVIVEIRDLGRFAKCLAGPLVLALLLGAWRRRRCSAAR